MELVDGHGRSESGTGWNALLGFKALGDLGFRGLALFELFLGFRALGGSGFRAFRGLGLFEFRV